MDKKKIIILKYSFSIKEGSDKEKLIPKACLFFQDAGTELNTRQGSKSPDINFAS